MKRKTYTFSIEPTSKGHHIWYVETFVVKADSEQEAQEAANRRENELVAGLMKLMPTGEWDCNVERL
jgi:hypothetical protein